MTFAGDKEYRINCTGDCCVGDEVAFERAVFVGKYPNSKLSHYELVKAKIVKDSYGKDKQQHTFTLRLEDDSLSRIKGRNLYRGGVWRKYWENEGERRKVLAEKHQRGAAARAERDERRRFL